MGFKINLRVCQRKFLQFGKRSCAERYALNTSIQTTLALFKNIFFIMFYSLDSLWSVEKTLVCTYVMASLPFLKRRVSFQDVLCCYFFVVFSQCNLSHISFRNPRLRRNSTKRNSKVSNMLQFKIWKIWTKYKKNFWRRINFKCDLSKLCWTLKWKKISFFPEYPLCHNTRSWFDWKIIKERNSQLFIMIIHSNLIIINAFGR